MLVLLWVSSIGQTVKQKNGYLGKSTMLGVGISFLPTMHPTTSLNPQELPERTFKIEPQIQIQSEFSISEQNSIEFLASYQRTSALIEMDSTQDVGWYEGGYRTVLYQEVTGYRGSPDIRRTSFVLSYCHYQSSSGGMAPLGRYVKFGMGFSTYSIDLSPIRIDLNSEVSSDRFSYSELYVANPEGRWSSLRYFLAFGNNIMFCENWIVNFQMSFNYEPNWKLRNIEIFEPTDHIYKIVREKLVRTNIFQFRVSCSRILDFS
jgi:hypothetical protein